MIGRNCPYENFRVVEDVHSMAEDVGGRWIHPEVEV